MKPDVSMIMSSGMAESMSSATLTPTTLKSLTQILESDGCLQDLQRFDDSGEYPGAIIVNNNSGNISSSNSGRTYVNLDSKSWQGGTTTVVTPSKCIPSIVSLLEVRTTGEEEEEEIALPAALTAETAVRQQQQEMRRRSSRAPKPKAPKVSPPPSRKRKSGRKPANADAALDELDMSPEEGKRLHMRRERNKEAAARCRKRRVDLTNTLMEEVEQHDVKKRALEEEIQQLKRAKEDLEFVLQAHAASCNLGVGVGVPAAKAAAHVGHPSSSLVVAVKSEPVLVEAADAPYALPEPVAPAAKRICERPATLSIRMMSSRTSPSGVEIETPSGVYPCLAFDAVTTGLTPGGAPPIQSIETPVFSPTLLNTPMVAGVVNCGSQQRSLEVAACDSSPDYVSL